MNRVLLLCACLMTCSLTLPAQENPSKPAETPAANKPASPATADHPLEPGNFTSAKGFVLEDGTPMRLRLNRTVSSADAHVGDTVDFEVLQDISVNGTLVIPKGGLAFGTVTEAQPKRRMARGGKLEINLDNVKLLDSEKAALRAVKGGSGGGHTGAMTAGIVATGLVFFPAAPFFLFMHGKDITIPKGAEVAAYVNGDVKMDLAKFQPTPVLASPATIVGNTPTSSASNSAKLQVDSAPPGADIEIDGSFAGNTPSEVQVTEGDHTITVKKSGFKDWERKMKVSSGSNIHLNAELERTSNP
jgi:PEGA domain-containing protein